MNPKPSYLGAFLKHPHNRVALLVSAVAAIFASIPFGWPGLALVGVVTLGTEILAALAIPELPSFRASVDRQQHQQARAQRRLTLLNELSNSGETSALATYQHMVGRVQALYQTAGDSRTTLTREDVEKLEDLTVDYLGLCVVNSSLKQRKDRANEDVVLKRIANIKTQLQDATLPDEETRQLRSALAQYTETMNRSRRLAVRRSALEATLMAMPEKMEEVYQLVITSPYSSEMGGKLEESLARLRIAEEVAAEFETPESFDFEAPPPVMAGATRLSRAQALQRASPPSTTSR